jgi:hypothetical protein
VVRRAIIIESVIGAIIIGASVKSVFSSEEPFERAPSRGLKAVRSLFLILGLIGALG